jgi:hypothetical protein
MLDAQRAAHLLPRSIEAQQALQSAAAVFSNAEQPPSQTAVTRVPASAAPVTSPSAAEPPAAAPPATEAPADAPPATEPLAAQVPAAQAPAIEPPAAQAPAAQAPAAQPPAAQAPAAQAPAAQAPAAQAPAPEAVDVSATPAAETAEPAAGADGGADAPTSEYTTAAADEALRAAVAAGSLDGLRQVLQSCAAHASAESVVEARKARDRLQARAKKAAQRARRGAAAEPDVAAGASEAIAEPNAAAAAAAAADATDAADDDDWGEGIVRRPGRGRCALATRALTAGSVLEWYSRAPYACVVLPSLHGSRCDRCFKEGSAAKPLIACARCKYVHYCSDACRAANASQHAHECAPLAHKRSALSALRVQAEPETIGRFGGLLLAVRCLWRQHEGRSTAVRDERGRLPIDERLFACLAPGQPSADDTALGELGAAAPGLLPRGVSAADVAALLPTVPSAAGDRTRIERDLQRASRAAALLVCERARVWSPLTRAAA